MAGTKRRSQDAPLPGIRHQGAGRRTILRRFVEDFTGRRPTRRSRNQAPGSGGRCDGGALLLQVSDHDSGTFVTIPVPVR